jgi:hypothetical protein
MNEEGKTMKLLRHFAEILHLGASTQGLLEALHPHWPTITSLRPLLSVLLTVFLKFISLLSNANAADEVSQDWNALTGTGVSGYWLHYDSATSWAWNFRDGTTAIVPHLSQTSATMETQHIVSLSATDPSGSHAAIKANHTSMSLTLPLLGKKSISLGQLAEVFHFLSFCLHIIAHRRKVMRLERSIRFFHTAGAALLIAHWVTYRILP